MLSVPTTTSTYLPPSRYLQQLGIQVMFVAVHHAVESYPAFSTSQTLNFLF